MHRFAAPCVGLAPTGLKLPKQSNHSIDWVGPTLVLTHEILSNPNLVSIYTNLISNYLYDLLRGREKSAIVKFSIVAEKNKSRSFTKITYEGSLEGMKLLPKIIRRATK